MLDCVVERAVVDPMAISGLDLFVPVVGESVDVLRRQSGRLTGCGMRWFFALAAVAFAVALVALALATGFAA